MLLGSWQKKLLRREAFACTTTVETKASKHEKISQEPHTEGRERLKSSCQPEKELASHEEISHSLTLVSPPGKTDQSQEIVETIV